MNAFQGWQFPPYLGYIPPAYVYDSWITTLKPIEYYQSYLLTTVNMQFIVLLITHVKIYMYYHMSKTWGRHNSQVTFYDMAHGMGTHASDWQVQ